MGKNFLGFRYFVENKEEDEQKCEKIGGFKTILMQENGDNVRKLVFWLLVTSSKATDKRKFGTKGGKISVIHVQGR